MRDMRLACSGYPHRARTAQCAQARSVVRTAQCARPRRRSESTDSSASLCTEFPQFVAPGQKGRRQCSEFAHAEPFTPDEPRKDSHTFNELVSVRKPASSSPECVAFWTGTSEPGHGGRGSRKQNPLFAEQYAAKARVLDAKANLLRRSVGRNSPGRRISGQQLVTKARMPALEGTRSAPADPA